MSTTEKRYMKPTRQRRRGSQFVRFDADPYQAILHARRVVGRLGSLAVQKRIAQAQALLYKIRSVENQSAEVCAVASIMRGCGIELMKAAAYLDQVAGREDSSTGRGDTVQIARRARLEPHES